MMCSSNSHKYFTFLEPYLFFHICDHLSIPCLADIFFLSLILISFEILQICASMHTTHAYEVLRIGHIYFLYLEAILLSNINT